MDWDAIQKRENQKVIEARKYGEFLKQQNEEIKERKLKERQIDIAESKKLFSDNQNKENSYRSSIRLINNTHNNKNERSIDSFNLFQNDIHSDKTNINSFFSGNNNNKDNILNSNLYNDDLKNISKNETKSRSINTNNTNNIINSNNNDSIEFNTSIGRKDRLRKKNVDEDVIVEKIPISHILIKMDKLQQLCYNNNKTVETLNNKYVENSIFINDVRNRLLERIEQGESKIIQLITNYTDKQKSLETAYHNEYSDQIQNMQNTINTLEGYIRKFNVKISDQESTIESLRIQLNANEKRLESLIRDYEEHSQKFKQDLESQNTIIEKNINGMKEELNSMVKNNEKNFQSKYNTLSESFQNEKNNFIINTNDIKKCVNNLSDIIKKVEEKEVQSINSLKDSLNTSQKVIASAMKDKEIYLLDYINKLSETIMNKINENSLNKQQQINEINDKTLSINNLMKEKIDSINKQQIKQSVDHSKKLTDIEEKFSNSLQHSLKEFLSKIAVMEESQKKRDQENSAMKNKLNEDIKNMEKKCNHDINSFKVTYNSKLNETLEKYEQDINKSISAKDNIIEDINYKIIQLFNRLNNQEEAHQSNTKNFNKMIQDLEENGEKKNILLNQEMNTMLEELKNQCSALNERFDSMDETQKKTVSELENKFKFKYIQVDQILEAYKEDFKDCVSRKEIEEISNKLNESTTNQINELKKGIDDNKINSEREIKTKNNEEDNHIQKLEDDFVKVKSAFLTQKDYQDIIDKVEKSSAQYNVGIKEINEMIDKMNNSLEIIDTNLLETVSQNYKNLNEKFDKCMNDCNNTSDSYNTRINELKTEFEKMKESITANKNLLTENEKAVNYQSTINEDFKETLQKLKQINEMKISKKEYQESLNKFESESQAMVEMYEQLRQDYKTRETNLQTKIKNLEELYETNNNNNNISIKQLKSTIDDNLHQLNKKITLINNYIDENKEKQEIIEKEISKNEANISSSKTLKLELEILEDKLGKLPSEEIIQSLVNKLIQPVKQNNELLENEIDKIKKTLRNHSLQYIYNNNENNNDFETPTRDRDIDKYETNNNSKVNNNNSRAVSREKTINEEERINRDNENNKLNKQELPSPIPAILMTTRELIIPGNRNNNNQGVDHFDRTSIQTLTIKEEEEFENKRIEKNDKKDEKEFEDKKIEENNRNTTEDKKIEENDKKDIDDKKINENEKKDIEDKNSEVNDIKIKLDSDSKSNSIDLNNSIDENKYKDNNSTKDINKNDSKNDSNRSSSNNSRNSSRPNSRRSSRNNSKYNSDDDIKNNSNSNETENNK